MTDSRGAGSPTAASGLSLAPFRGLRFQARAVQSPAGASRDLGRALCPPYDVISAAEREELSKAGDANAVRLILPGPAEAELGAGDPYRGAQVLLTSWVQDGLLAPDLDAALYVYEMTTPDGASTRGLVGAVELRDPDDGVILPHENTMAGPVSDRLALMTATQANLEPIYLVYDGGGPASGLVASVSGVAPLAVAETPDHATHRLWAVTDKDTLAAVAADLAGRRALIADGHHRYATYRQLQADHHGQPGPWDRGLALLVDTSAYGPQVHPIHRVVRLGWDELILRSATGADVGPVLSVDAALAELAAASGFAVVLARDAEHAVLLSDVDAGLMPVVGDSPADQQLAALDVTIVHRVLVERLWGLSDTEDVVGYAHDVSDALAGARADGGVAVLLRATPVAAVAAVAAAGGRMPRKSTLFTPKPASGMVIRRFVDQSI